MSRCGSCPAYGANPACKGDLPVEQCTTVLQEMIVDLRHENQQLRKKLPIHGIVNQFAAAVEAELAKLSPPEKPSCYPNGKWNRNFYGNAGNRMIYVDNKAVQISAKTYVTLARYVDEYREYEKKVDDIKAGIGIHKDGICPVCGG